MNLVLHPATKQQLETYAKAPSHAVILTGPTGIGKTTLARQAAADVLQIEKVDDYPYGLTIKPEEGKAIGIEAVRQLEHFLSLKVPRPGQYNRYVIVEEAHNLTIEAQNALLKTLEEPPEGTILIMTASHEQSLLPTIRSRAQAIAVTRPERSQVEAHFAEDFDDKAIKQAYAISGGLPGLMSAILNETDHPLMEATNYARQLLSKSAYERLLLVDQLAKNKGLASDVTLILQQMAHISLQTVAAASAKKWQNVLNASYQASESLSTNTQPKLVLTNLMLTL